MMLTVVCVARHSGGWFHPVHIHLIDLVPLRREVGIDIPGLNKDGLFEWEVGAAKDVFYLGPGDTMWVIARFGPHTGDYMFHCHNLVHEDNDMMLAFGVSGPNPEADAPDSPYPSYRDPMKVLAKSLSEADPVNDEYLLANMDFYNVFYPPAQVGGKRKDCGNFYEVEYTKPCKAACCRCNEHTSPSSSSCGDYCPALAPNAFEVIECASGETPPFFQPAAAPVAAPSLATVTGVALVDTKEGVHYADPVPDQLVAKYSDIGHHDITFCANLDTMQEDLPDGVGVNFIIKERTSEGVVVRLRSRATTSPYCATVATRDERDLTIRFEPLNPYLTSGVYTVVAQVKDSSRRTTPASTTTIRIRG